MKNYRKLGIFIAIFYLVGANEPVLYGVGVFIVIVISLRMIIPRAHRQGIAMCKRKKYEEAIPFFEQSYRFFTSNKWVDDYRFVTIFSSSRISYREIALLNIAFCHAQAGNREESKEYYQEALTEFPESEVAKAALKLVGS